MKEIKHEQLYFVDDKLVSQAFGSVENQLINVKRALLIMPNCVCTFLSPYWLFFVFPNRFLARSESILCVHSMRNAQSESDLVGPFLQHNVQY